jgi:hypothetical protein
MDERENIKLKELRKRTGVTTGNPGFAESLKLSAKATKPSAKPLPRVALSKGPTGNFFSATILCRALEL